MELFLVFILAIFLLQPSFIPSSVFQLWKELRSRLFTWLACLILFTLICIPFSNRLFDFYAKPLLKTLNASQHLIATGILSGFWIPIELSLWFALLLSIPFLLWQVWQFAKSALKPEEKFWGKIYLIGSVGSFFCGICFSYFVVLPICLHVLIHAAPQAVNVMPDILNYLNFSFRLMLAFGLACQLPLTTLILCQLKITSIEQLKSYRRYVIIGAFVIGMIIAPDVISQCLLSIPLWLLFELGILLAQFTLKNNQP